MPCHRDLDADGNLTSSLAFFGPTRLNKEKAAVRGLSDGNCMLALVFNSGTFPRVFYHTSDDTRCEIVVVENNPKERWVSMSNALIGFQVGKGNTVNLGACSAESLLVNGLFGGLPSAQGGPSVSGTTCHSPDRGMQESSL